MVKMAENKEYVCTLSPELIEKAEKELNENPKTRNSNIQALRELVVKYPGLKIRTDDGYLLQFLRAKKFDTNRAFSLILNQCTMKIAHEQIFSNLRPSAIKIVIDDGVTAVFTHRDKLGCRVVISRAARWDTSRYGMDEIYREFYIILSKLIKEEETQINGIRYIIDLKDISWAHALQITPYYAKLFSSIIQDAFPMRLKGIHYVNEPVIFDYIFAIIRPFLNAKTVSRLHFHGQNVQELTEFIDEDNLPEEYGGKQPPFSSKEWEEKILKCDAEFDEDAKYGLLNLGAEATKNKEDAMEGTIGSFKKLNV